MAKALFGHLPGPEPRQSLLDARRVIDRLAGDNARLRQRVAQLEAQVRGLHVQIEAQRAVDDILEPA